MTYNVLMGTLNPTHSPTAMQGALPGQHGASAILADPAPANYHFKQCVVGGMRLSIFIITLANRIFTSNLKFLRPSL